MENSKTYQSIGVAIDYIRFSILGTIDIVESTVEGLALSEPAQEMIRGSFQQYRGHEFYENEQRYGFVGFDVGTGGLLEYSGYKAYTNSPRVRGYVDGRIEFRLSRLDVCNTIKMRHGELKRIAIESAECGESEFSQLIDKGEGCSVYYGSRENEKYCRIYEKLIDGIEYVRFEFELKGRKSAGYTGGFFLHDIGEFSNRVYQREFDMLLNKNSSIKIPARLFVLFRNGVHGKIVPTPRPKPDIQAWLWGQIYPILMRDDHMINEFVRAVYFEKIVQNHDFPVTMAYKDVDNDDYTGIDNGDTKG